MKLTYILGFLTLSFTFLHAQNNDTIVPHKGNIDKQLIRINERKIKMHSDSLGDQPIKSRLIDSTFRNRYGDLLNNDPEYTKKIPLWVPAVEVMGGLVFTWSVDRFIINGDYARIGIETWKSNIKKGWEWDNDRFGVNFLGHPYSGTLSFSAARSNGYNFYQSFPFAVGGSLIWEYFGENTRPAYNDIINTSLTGAFLGEILYRLSSNILDDRTRGTERVFREIAAGIVDPMRGLNRLLQGKSSRVTNKEIYQKEPINITLFAGVHRINDKINRISGKGTNSIIANFQMDYGNPFETRFRKPFDFFKIRANMDIGVGRK
jgi:hypothetical protein